MRPKCTVKLPRLTVLLKYSYLLTYLLAYLLKKSTICDCRYDHLARVLTKVLDERPDNAADIIEDLSRETKQTKFTSDVDTVLDKAEPSAEVALAEIQMKLFAVRASRLLPLLNSVLDTDSLFSERKKRLIYARDMLLLLRWHWLL